MSEIREVEKLSLCREGLLAAYRAGLHLQEKGWMMWPAASWDKPAILALNGEACVAGVNWSIDDSNGAVSVDFAWCSPEHPAAFSACLLRFRQKLRETPPTWLSFTCHRGNEPMEKLVRRMKLEPHSQSYRVPQGYFEARTEVSEKPFFVRLREAASAFSESWARGK